MIRGLVVDWGGVLTAPVHLAVRRWIATSGIDHGHYAAVVRRWLDPGPGASSPVHRLERGESSIGEFERELAAALAQEGSVVEADGLVSQMFADLATYEDSMTSLVARARTAGVRTALLSNSWGNDYDRTDWHRMFDAVVISGEVGLRKPEPEIFVLVLDRLGLQATECVFVDDLPHNVEAAARLGLVGVLHRTFAETAARLEALFPDPAWVHGAEPGAQLLNNRNSPPQV
jgi:epoxide hydrolase-like predicted phosphatase